MCVFFKSSSSTPFGRRQVSRRLSELLLVLILASTLQIFVRLGSLAQSILPISLKNKLEESAVEGMES